MIAWQLFVPLVVLLASDEALARKDVECAYFDNTFCFYTKVAYEQAREVEEALKDQEKFKDDKRRVSDLILEILKILKMENKSELLAPLKRALGMSNNALFQTKVSCNGKREDPVCETSLQGLFYVTYNLVLDATQATVETQQDKIDAALNTFEDLKRERTNMTLIEYVDHVYTLGTKVESYLSDTTS